MTPALALRLCLDLVAAGLLVFGLSYWWLSDDAHQVAGLVMFGLVIVHNVFNRRWYGRAAQTRHPPASLFNVGVTAILAATMLLLLGTSAAITTYLPEWIPADMSFTARQLHVLAAYWAFVVVAVHLGLRWPTLMAVTRRAFGITQPSRLRTSMLRFLTGGIAACGVWSFSVLQLGTRLTMQVSLEWWNFEQAVLGFFGHCAAAAGLLIASSHYAALLLRRMRPARATHASP